MRAVLTRVTSAAVTIDGTETARIGKGFLVLLGVQYLKQGRGRVTVGIVGELVDLVQQDQGIAYPGLGEGVNDSSGHGADVGLAVAADLGFVMDATQRNAG